MKQLDLFGKSAHAAPTLPAPDPSMVALAKHVPPHVLLGGSSWTFRGWHPVYRRAYRSDAQFMRESLYEYARFPLFRTAGIDRSYYGPIPEDDLATYASQLPPGFRCVSKVWSEITTFVFPQHPRFGDRAGKLNALFLDHAQFEAHVGGPYRRAFADHAGPFVIEIPTPPGSIDVRVFEAKLEAFLEGADPQWRYAFELRDVRLMTPRYFDMLRAHGASHCFNYWSKMPTIRQQLQKSGIWTEDVVTRLLLPPGGSYEELKEEYAPFDKIVAADHAMREDVLHLSDAVRDHGAHLYVIINNKAEGSAPLTAAALAELFRSRNDAAQL